MILQNPADKDCDRDNDDDERNTNSACNSFDERCAQTNDITPESKEQFMKSILDRGFVFERVDGNGACLFRSIALHIYGDQEWHKCIRKETMDHIVSAHYIHVLFNDFNFLLFFSLF